MSTQQPNNPPPEGWGVNFWQWVLANIQYIKRRLNGMGSGGGGSQDLQSVTTIGATTDIPMSVIDSDGNTVTVSAGIITLNNTAADTDISSTATTRRSIHTPDADGTIALIEQVLVNPMTEDLNMNTHQINNLVAPTVGTDAANKDYVDTFVQGLSTKTAVRVATATALDANTYNNGAGTITITATGTLTVDGVVTALDDRILVKDEGTTSHNGIYTVTTAGDVGVQAVLTRSTDADTGAELVAAYVQTGVEGTTNAGVGYVQGTPSPITLGTSPIVWNVFNNNVYNAGTGIRIASNLIYAKLSEGVAGGQAVKGGTNSDDTLTVDGSISTDPRLTTAPAIIMKSGGVLGGTNTAQVFASVPFTVDQSGTAGYTGLKIAASETATGSGTKNLFQVLAGAVGTSSKFSISNTGTTTWADGANFVLGSTTGTQIGTFTNQKIGFFGSTPVVQQSGDGATALATYGLGTLTFNGSGGLLNIQTITATGAGTYTPTSGTTTAIAILVGAGGGGGSTSGASGSAAGAGGGYGGHLIAKITSVTGTYTVGVGAGGTGATAGTGTGSTGNGGGNTTFVNAATTYTAGGGSGGACRTALTTSNAIAAAIGGSGGSATNGLVNSPGASGTAGVAFVTGTAGTSGDGGSGPYGGGGKGLSKDATVGSTGTGNNGTGYGSGGGGGLAIAGSGQVAGGNGANGIIIIYEYR